MNTVALVLILLVLLCLLAGLVRVVKGPTISDGLLGIQFSSTLAIALFALIGVIWEAYAFIDIALIISVLGVPAVLAFARFKRTESEEVTQ